MEASQKFRSRARKELKVSVCIPTYNAAKTIERCLESILNQTVKPSEILVVDGYSEDGTLKIIEKYPDVKVLGFARGIGKARKILADRATGDIIAWVDADVEVPPNWLEVHLKVNEGKEIKILSSGRKFRRRTSPVSEFSCEEKPAHEWLGIVQAACTMKKEIFSVVNYDERFKRGEDWEFVVSAHREGIRSHYCDGLFAFHISRPRTRYLKDMIYAGNYVTYLGKYGLWYVKFNPRHFLAFLLRIALIYAIPISLIFRFPLALLVYPVAWCAYSLDEKKLAHPIKLLVEIMKGIGEHLYLFKVL